jgi:hypothetical protein
MRNERSSGKSANFFWELHQSHAPKGRQIRCLKRHFDTELSGFFHIQPLLVIDSAAGESRFHEREIALVHLTQLLDAITTKI